MFEVVKASEKQSKYVDPFLKSDGCSTNSAREVKVEGRNHILQERRKQLLWLEQKSK